MSKQPGAAHSAEKTIMAELRASALRRWRGSTQSANRCARINDDYIPIRLALDSAFSFEVCYIKSSSRNDRKDG